MFINKLCEDEDDEEKIYFKSKCIVKDYKYNYCKRIEFILSIKIY